MEVGSGLPDTDLYTAQLQEVFNSCDTVGQGFLDRGQLIHLCHRLQLSDHAQDIVEQLLDGVPDDVVRFDKFKDSFVSILCGTQVSDAEGSLASDEEEHFGQNGDPDQRSDSSSELPPLYIKDGKRYGRRSKPLFTSDEIKEILTLETAEGETTQTQSNSKGEENEHPQTKRSKRDDEKRSPREDVQLQDLQPNRDKYQMLRDSQASLDTVSSLSEEEIEKEMFEAEGQMNLTFSELEQAQTDDTETELEYLRNVWQGLGVGKQGFITLPELALVCDHIGMEEMNNEQLQQLFDKLDSDGDGKVSLDDFLKGLFQHNMPTCHTPRSIGTPTPRAVSAQKKVKVLAPSNGEERMTPSIVPGTGASGIFSSLDPERTGFAMPDYIIDLWEKYNVSNGADILLALEFDLNTKVNLAELSSYLEQELINADDQNAVYQAALSSYQQEIRHLKSSTEQYMWETEKLRHDLNEANVRNSKLAKEVDERHAQMEQSTQKKLLTVEKKYQEQVKSLQSELEQERELYGSQTTKLKHKLESEIKVLKEEEGKLRDNLVQAQKEIERLESELIDNAEKHTDTERQNVRLHKELQTLEDIQTRLDEYERAGVVSPEEKRFTENKITKMQSDNKDLKDMNDELTAELESIKLQLPNLRRNHSTTTSSPRDFVSRIPVRDGSVLSDYFGGKPKLRSSMSSENSDDEPFYSSMSPVTGSKARRRLPTAPDEDETSVDRELVDSLKKELTDLTAKYEKERQERDLQHTTEISQKDSRHDDEKEQLLQKFESEKKKILEDDAKHLQTALINLKETLQCEHSQEKQSIMDKHEAEKVLLKQQFKEEKQHYAESLQQEFSQDLQAQIAQIREEYNRDKAELDEYLSRPDEAQYQQLLQEKSELEEQLILQKEEEQKQIEAVKQSMMADCEAQLDKAKSNFDSEILQQTEKLQRNLEVERSKFEVQILSQRDQFESDFGSRMEEERSNFDLQVLSQREELEAKFNEDREKMERKFEEEIKKMKEEHEQEIKKMKEEHEQEIKESKQHSRQELQSVVDKEQEVQQAEQQEREKLSQDFQDQTKQNKENFDRDVEEIVSRYEEQIGSLRDQLDRLSEKLEEEREAMERRFEEERDALEDDLTTTIREEIEEEFVQQVEQLKDSFEAEKHALQEQVIMYQSEVEELQQELERVGNPRKQADSLNKTVLALQKEKKLAEKAQEEMQKTLFNTREDMERTLEDLQFEHDTKVQELEAEKEQLEAQCKDDLEKEKMAYNTVLREKIALETLVTELKNENKESVQMTDSEKSKYEIKIKDLEKQVLDFKTKVIAPHAKSVIDDLQKENDDLNNTLASTKTKLDEMDEKVKQLAVQQEEFNLANSENKQLYVKVDLLNHQLGDTVEGIQKEKEKMMALQLERDRLEKELVKVSGQLTDASFKLAQHQSEHSREVEKLKNSKSVDTENYLKLQMDLVGHQQKVRDLQNSIQIQENDSNEKYKAKEDEFNKLIDSLYDEKASLQRKLKLTKEMLEEQLEKIKAHYSDCEKKNVMVVDLYKENANLMEALYVMEERKKDAVTRCYHLEDQCKALRKMLKKVCHVAIS